MYINFKLSTCVHQYVSENVIRTGGDFGAIFWKKPWAFFQKMATGYFSEIGPFLKWP